MTEYSAFKIDVQTLEKLRTISEAMERSMAGQVRFMVDRELKDLANRGMVSGDGAEEGEIDENL